MTRIVPLMVILSLLSGCSTYPLPQEVVPPQTPYWCTGEFAESFAAPFLLFDGLVRYAGFSPDCRRCYTVDEDVQRLRVSDLETRTSVEYGAGVYSAWFTRDSRRVFYLVSIADSYEYELYITDGDAVHRIDTGTSTTVAQSPDGMAIAYLKNYDMETYQADLYLARIDRLPPEVSRVAGGVMGAPAFTPDGQRLVYQGDAVHHHIERDELWCDWYTTRLHAWSLDGGADALLGEDVQWQGFRISEDGGRVYAAADYSCEAQTQSLMSYPIGGGDPVRLLQDQPVFLGPQETLELPEHGELLHVVASWVGDTAEWRSELWATKTDGSGSRVLAEDVMSQMQTCMVFTPFQRAFDDVLLFIRRESHELVALERDGSSWDVLDGAQGFWYLLSPDGRSLLSYTDVYSPADLVVTEVVGGGRRTLLTGLVPGNESAWTATGERVLVLPASVDGGVSRPLYSVDPKTGESHVLADDVPGQWLYGNSFVPHPGGYLVAVQRTGGMFLTRIP